MDILFLRNFQMEFGVHPIKNSGRYNPKHIISKTLTCCLIRQSVCVCVCVCAFYRLQIYCT